MLAGAAWIGAETAMLAPAGALVVKNGAAVRAVDRGGERAGERVDRGEVAVDRAAGLADRQQAAHLAARRPASGRRAGPVRGLVGDDRVAGAAGAVDEGDVGRAALELLDGDLAVLRELIDQQVAAVHQVVRAVAVGDERADRLVQARELGRDLLDVAAGAGDRVVLAHGRVLRGDHLRADRVDRVRQRAGLLDERLLGGLIVRRLREVRPGLPELRQLGVDAGVGRLVERELGGVQTLGAGLPVAEVRVLGAVLRIQELVADAAEALDVDAASRGGRRSCCRRRRPGSAARARPTGALPDASSRPSTRSRCCGRWCRAFAAARSIRAATSAFRRTMRWAWWRGYA